MNMRGRLTTASDESVQWRGYRILVSFQRVGFHDVSRQLDHGQAGTQIASGNVRRTPSGQAGAIGANLVQEATINVTNRAFAEPPTGVVGVSLSLALSAPDLAPPLTWALAEGQVLPAGLILDPGGNIVGTPTQSGEFGVLLAATDSKRAQANISTRLVIDSARIVAAPLTTVRMTVDVALDGAFTVDLPEPVQIRSAVALRVLGPIGDELKSVSIAATDVSAELRIQLPSPAVVEPVAVVTESSGRRKVAGYVLDQKGRAKLPAIQVLLQAKSDATGPWQPIAVTKTDRNGYFSTEVPVRLFAEVQAVVGIDGVGPIQIPVEKGLIANPVLLPIDGAKPADDGEDGCGCHTDYATPVDMEDLTNASGSFSADAGGGRCVTFTVPNRSIEEFTYQLAVRLTDPQIKGLNTELPNTVSELDELIGLQHRELSKLRAAELGMVANPEGGAVKVKALAAVRDQIAEFSRSLKEMIRFRAMLADSPNGLITRAPISVNNSIDWDADPTVFQATTVAYGHLLELKQVWRSDGYSLGDLLYSLPLAPCQKKQIAVIDWERRETAKRSENVTATESLESSLTHDRDITETVKAVVGERQAGTSAAATSGFSMGLGGIFQGGFLGMGGGIGGASSAALQLSSRNTASSSLQQLRDKTMQAASSLRTQRSTVIQTVTQGESSRVQTEVVANHNHCHSITIQYFQVLRHLRVDHELSAVRECLFVPLLLTPFDAAKVLRWRDVLSAALLDKTLAPDLSAVERKESGLPLIPPPPPEEPTIATLHGTMQLSITVSRPGDEPNGAFSAAAWAPLAPFLSADPLAVWTSTLQSLTGASSFVIGNTQEERRNNERNAAFAQSIAPQVARAAANRLRLGLYGSGGHRRVDISFGAPSWQGLPNSFTNTLQLHESVKSVEKIGIECEALPMQIQITVHGLKLEAKSATGTNLFNITDQFASRNLAAGAGILDNLRGWLYTVPANPSTTPTQSVVAPEVVDMFASERLLRHLNANLEYYHRTLWLNMDPDRRYLLLDGYLAQNGRSLASVVENRVIGVAGNSVILPVAQGFTMDPQASRPYTPEELVARYRPTRAEPPVRVSFPTGGVFAESVMGSCNSCEVKDDTRFWCDDECPCGDEPTPINPVTVPTPVATTPNLTAKDFPAAIVNFQTAPPAPDPTGLAAALQLLGSKDLFRDVTGLTKNQENAAEALSTSLATAEAFGMKAGDIMKMGMAQQNASKTLQNIDGAKQKGLLTEEQARDLTNSLFKTLTGQPEKNPATEPTTDEKLKTVKDAAKAGDIDQPKKQELVGRILDGIAGSGTDSPTLAELPAIANLLQGEPGVKSVVLTKGTDSISITQADHAAAWKDPFPSPPSDLSVVRGIDVSRHQGAIDWTKVREDRVFFAYIKASQKVADPQFQQNWTGAESAGLFRGAYHFCDPSKTAQEQVQLFLSTVGAIGAADLPPVLDVEDNESIDWNLLPDGAARRALIDGWLTGVQTALGRRPVIYTNASFFDNWQIPTAGLEQYPLWIANPSKNPLSPRMPSQWNDWAIWQMSWTGKVSGIKGDVDLNWFNGDGRRFIQFLMASIL